MCGESYEKTELEANQGDANFYNFFAQLCIYSAPEIF